MTRHELRTPRLSLREWRDSDREPYAAMNADPEVMRWFPSTQSREESDAGVDRFSAHHDEHGYTAWVVEVIESDRGASPFVGAAFPFPSPLSSAVRSLSSGGIVESSFSSRGPMLVTLRR